MTQTIKKSPAKQIPDSPVQNADEACRAPFCLFILYVTRFPSVCQTVASEPDFIPFKEETWQQD